MSHRSGRVERSRRRFSRRFCVPVSSGSASGDGDDPRTVIDGDNGAEIECASGDGDLQTRCDGDDPENPSGDGGETGTDHEWESVTTARDGEHP